jgi:hypothetical protein
MLATTTQQMAWMLATKYTSINIVTDGCEVLKLDNPPNNKGGNSWNMS